MRAVRKTASVAAAFVAVTGLTFAAVAYACTALATLSLSAPAGNPGSSTTVTGSGFAAAGVTAAAPVAIHFGGIDSPVLAEATPDRTGSISVPIAIPENANPGPQVIVATQKNAKGEAQGGTPARAPFQVTGPGAQAATPQQSAPEGRSVPASDSSGGIGIALGAIGLVVFAGGFVTFLAARRQSGTGARAARS